MRDMFPGIQSVKKRQVISGLSLCQSLPKALVLCRRLSVGVHAVHCLPMGLETISQPVHYWVPSVASDYRPARQHLCLRIS